ncbi:MAG: PadR family transcriptional regulator [Firmicutes bacterium]|nr:PadR family transcriptional regulator [Bacillota bacterium]
MKLDKGLVGGSTVLLVLTLLAEKDYYGYEIIKTLEERSDKTFQFKEGSLYPVLHRLENDGFVKSYRQKSENGKERKYYCITPSGQEQLSEERQQWRIFSSAVNKVAMGSELSLA